MKNRIHKHTRHTILIILLLAVAFGGCQRGVRVRGELAMLDSLVDVDYDSALSVLVQLDTRQMGKGERMYAQLLMGKAMNKADSLFTTDSVMKEVVRYFDRHGNSNQRMLAHYVLGCAYRDMGDAPRAIQCYQEAVEQADTTRSDCDLSTLMRVHSQTMRLYRMQRLTDDERKEAAEGARIAWNIGDTLSALRLEQDKAIGLFKEERYEECIEAAKNLQEKCLRCQRSDLADIMNVSILKSYLQLHDYEQAKIYLDRYEAAKVWQENSSRVNGGFGALYFYKGSYFKGIGQTDSAEYYYQKSLLSQGPRYVPIPTYMGLCDIYEATGPVDSLYKYTKLYIAEHARKYDEETMTTMAQMQSLYGYNAESRKAEKEMERVAVLRKWGWGTSVAVVLLSLLLWNLRLRKGKEINRLLAEHWQTSEQISFARKQVEELNEQKEDSNQRIQSLSTLLREAEKREKELNEQIQRIATVKRRRDLPNTDIVKAFHRFAIDRSNLKQVHWQMLRELVEDAFPSFYEELHRGAAPLTDNEYQMCLLMKCKFQTKEIDNILGTHNYTSSTQKRLLKKVYGVDGDAKTFAKKVAEISE